MAAIPQSFAVRSRSVLLTQHHKAVGSDRLILSKVNTNMINAKPSSYRFRPAATTVMLEDLLDELAIYICMRMMQGASNCSTAQGLSALGAREGCICKQAASVQGLLKGAAQQWSCSAHPLC